MHKCKCMMGLGSYSQCNPVDVELHNWKPQYLAYTPYTIPVGEEGATYVNPYNTDAQIVEDLSHLEAVDSLHQEAEVANQKQKATGKFWLATAIAYMIFK